MGTTINYNTKQYVSKFPFLTILSQLRECYHVNVLKKWENRIGISLYIYSKLCASIKIKKKDCKIIKKKYNYK